MKKTLVAVLLLLALLAGAAVFLLDTGAGLRWTVHQVLARSGAEIEIGVVRGRLLGPISLSDVRYRQGDGAHVRIRSIDLEWRPADLLHGLLHVSGLRLSGLDYSPAQPAPGAARERVSAPEIALPLKVRVDRLTVVSAKIGLRSGTPFLVESVSLALALAGRSLTVSDLQVTTSRYRVEHGRARIELNPGLPIAGSLDWAASPRNLPPLEGGLKIDGTVDDTLQAVMDLRQPFAAHGEASVSSPLAQPSWNLATTIPQAVSLADIRKGWPPVSIQGTLKAQGNTSHARVQPDLSLAFRGRRVRVNGDASLTSDAVVIQQARVMPAETPGASVQLSGRVGLDRTLPFKLEGTWTALHGPEQAPWSSRTGRFQASGDRSSFVADVSGVITPPHQNAASTIKVELNASHLQGEPVVAGKVHLPYFSWSSLRALDLNADLDYHAAEGSSSKVLVKAAELQVGNRHATRVKFQATGNRGKHELALDGVLDGWPLDLGVTGSYSDEHWTGRLQRLSMTSRSNLLPGRWQIAQPADLAWTPSGARVGRFCMVHEGAKLCAGGHFANGKNWDLAAEASGFPLKWLAPGASHSLKVEGTATAMADIADRGKGIEGKANLEVASATVTWASEQQPVTTHYRDVGLDATVDPTKLHVALHGDLDQGGTIRGEISTSDPLANDGAIQGSLDAHLPSLRLVQAAFPDLGLSGGSARFEFKVDGTRSAPRFTGAGRIEQAKVDVSALGIRLESLNVDVKSSNARSVHITAQARSGDGTLEAQGELGWPDGGGWQGNFNLTGKQAALARLPQAEITGSPDLHVSINKAGGKVQGSIQLTKANLTPEAARPKVTISQDFVVVGKSAPKETASNPMNWDLDVTVDLGDHTRFKGYGVSGRLSGSLTLNAPAHRTTRANGSVQIHNGQYSFYGRTFDITNGALLYAGGPIDNPGVDVQVGRKVGDLNVTLAVTGPLVNPNINLSSTPAMSDTDKMSYLLLGRPASQASGAEATVLIKAAASLIPGGSHGATGFLQSTLGLDTLEVKTEANQTRGTSQTQGTSLVLGKYLSPRLYVSYAAGVQQAVDVFRVRYELARHWLLQAESSAAESGGDLMFKW